MKEKKVKKPVKMLKTCAGIKRLSFDDVELANPNEKKPVKQVRKSK